MKRHFNKELVMTKEDNENLKKSTKCWVCDNDYIDTDVKISDHYHISGKYRDSAHRVCNINLKLNHNLIIDNNEHKQAKGMNKNVVATISHNEYKDVLLNNKCIRHSMNRTQRKDQCLALMTKYISKTIDTMD